MKHYKKLHKLIYKYIDEHFGDLTLEKVYHCSYHFSDNRGRVIFRYYKKCHWDEFDDYLLKISPMIDFIELSRYNALNAYFGDFWIPVFKEWLKNTHDLELETIYNDV
jgi:hypothetical protein